MSLSRERITHLLNQFSARKTTPVEEQELWSWVESCGDIPPVEVEEHIYRLVRSWYDRRGINEHPGLTAESISGIQGDSKDGDTLEEFPETYPFDSEGIYRRILAARKTVLRTLVRKIGRFAAAAAIIGAIAGTGYYLSRGNLGGGKVVAVTINQPKDLPPGTNKAILTLSGGKQIILDSVASGAITRQGATDVVKEGNGLLSYHAGSGSEAPSTTAVAWNTLTTPRGGQYQLILPDGSKVWLNAASSITFPASFTGKDRKVTLTGEAYFEVKHDGTHPFIVNVNGAEVQDIGTHFDINGYGDEPSTKVTLIEGSVKVLLPASPTQTLESRILKPGEQAEFDPGTRSGLRTVNNVDLDQVLAWQHGMFEFDNIDLQAIMRQVGRWYDVDIQYEKKPGTEKFGGGISKNLPLSNVLKLLEANGVKFDLEGKVLKVTP
ncbi:MAG: FecR domain-containing protein [Bacteroidota bacterium]|nr:FecR domain-containing protein [Bacteroidota bacterium]